MSQDFNSELIDLLARHNQLGNYSRDHEIRQKYAQMRAEGMSYKEARKKLSEIKYNGCYMSEKNIENIIYDKREPEVLVSGNRSNRIIIVKV